ncbi:MAG: hypothetical protein LBS18_02270 [Clostridiales bacterium]|jgi:hypothetical protein|nr:hypothetical protein [Clostridiales bacterium]
MKRFIAICLAVLLAISLAGCRRNRKTPAPTQPPVTSAPPAAGATPRLADDYGNPGSTENPNKADNFGGGGTSNGVNTIPNFREGTEMEASDLPDIKSSLQSKFAGATINKITHGWHAEQHVYVVEYTLAGGAAGTAYIRPDGTHMPVA